MSESRWDYWNSPLYKPKTKLGPIFWDDFMRGTSLILENQRRRIANPYDKDPNKARELEVYDVFEWLRQELHNELPYSENFRAKTDAEVEKEVMRERRLSRTTK